MAAHGVLPHVIAILGDPFWSRACASFRSGTFAQIRLKQYEACQGSCLHYVNRLTLDVGGPEHVLLLLQLRHPASRRAMGSPKWLAQQPEFTAMLAVSNQGSRG